MSELYFSGKTEFHIHFNSVRPYCANYRSGEVFEIGQMFPVNGMGHEFMVSLGGDERSMFSGVGNVSKFGRPVASVVRLQSLDGCHMCGIETVEPVTLFPPLEALFAVFNRKLCFLFDRSRVEDGS